MRIPGRSFRGPSDDRPLIIITYLGYGSHIETYAGLEPKIPDVGINVS